MTAFAALFLNAYRELNAKKLFWVTLVISGIVMLLYMSMGFDEDGVFLFFGLLDIDSEMFARGSGLDVVLYRSIFTYFIVGIWLAWALIILALVSTSSIFPDAMADGTIDLTLSKPIRRVTLFSFKYFTGLLFVLLQVTVFCVGVFLAMGWRIGQWEWMIFAAIPIITLVFSYLFAINVLIGVVTRSALAALLLTILLWFLIFVLHQAGTTIAQLRQDALYQIEQAEALIQPAIDRQESAAEGEVSQSERQATAQFQEEIAEARAGLEKIERWHRPARIVQTILPKTAESTDLVDRWLTRENDISFLDVMMGNIEQNAEGDWQVRGRSEDEEVQMRTVQEMRQRSLWYVIGTSLIFEAVLLVIAGWIFCRRDF